MEIATHALKRVVLINPQHSYGGRLVYLNGSLSAIGAVLMATGHQVTVVDLNIDRLHDETVKTALRSAHSIGISLTGAPYIPEMLHLIPALREINDTVPILLGGQVIEQLTAGQFGSIYGQFQDVRAIRHQTDLTREFGGKEPMPSPFRLPFQALWQAMGEERMVRYMREEMTLVSSQGCHFHCAFCAARKGETETHRDIDVFTDDLRYLSDLAGRKGIPELRFYASSLDFFQNPSRAEEQLRAVAEVSQRTGIRIRIRCLSCLTSFLKAAQHIADFRDLLEKAGLWCVGFGSDGTDKAVWEAQRKPHNTRAKLRTCVKISRELGLRAELLMVLGFPQENVWTLLKTFFTSIYAVVRYPHVIIRPYLAKPFVPGNKGWSIDMRAVARLISDPTLFYNLDFAALGSRLTHPCFLLRAMSNLAYLGLCMLALFGKSSTSPLLPQGGRGPFAKLARLVNRLMPFDH